MSNNDINNLDPEDIGLKQVMGNRFHDETRKPMAEPFSTRTTNTIPERKMAQKPVGKSVKEQWEPERPAPNWKDNLKSCVKAVALFGCLSCLIFYWKEAGLMAESIAVPSIAICTALAGFGAGRSVRGKR